MSSAPPENQSPRASQRETGRRLHRRETRRQIIPPFIFGLFIIIGILVVMLLLPEENREIQAQAVADFLYTLFILCPATLCMFVLLLGAVAAVYGMNRLHDSTGTPLEKIENLTENMATRVENMTTKANDKVSEANIKLAPLLKLASVFDRENKDEPSSDKGA